MERRWLISALALAAITAVPAAADETAPKEGKPAAPVQVAQGTEPSPMPAPEEKQPDLPAPRLTYGGSADFYWVANLNDPWTGTNGLSVFDFKNQDGINLGLIDAWVQYGREGWNPGGRLDLMWGPSGRIVNFLERTISGDDIWDHVEQAFISFNLTKDGKTYADFGRWVTPAGAEVIEPKDNWLYSRGILFGFAIPFTHTGFRVYHYFNDTDYLMGHVNTGWDSVSWRSNSPGFGLSYGKALNPRWTLIANYLGGDEPNRQGDDSFRNLIDIVALYNASEKWAYTFNLDYGTQSGDNWFGISAQAKYTLNPKSYLAARAEFLTDDSGFRIGADTTAAGVTLGYTYLWSKYFQTRAEFRYDFAGEDLFPDDRRFTFTDNQPRFILAAIASY